MDQNPTDREKIIERVEEIRRQLSQMESLGSAAGIGAIAAAFVPVIGLALTPIGAVLGALALGKRFSLKHDLERELGELESHIYIPDSTGSSSAPANQHK